MAKLTNNMQSIAQLNAKINATLQVGDRSSADAWFIKKKLLMVFFLCWLDF